MNAKEKVQKWITDKGFVISFDGRIITGALHLNANDIVKLIKQPESPSPQSVEAKDWVKRYADLRDKHNMTDSINQLVKEVQPEPSLSEDWVTFKKCFFDYYGMGGKTREQLYEWVKNFLAGFAHAQPNEDEQDGLWKEVWGETAMPHTFSKFLESIRTKYTITKK